MTGFPLIQVLIGIFILLVAVEAEQLVLLQEVFRHGARYALTEVYQTEGAVTGELTNVGKRMHYLLGQRLYKEYWSRLGMPNKYDHRLIHVNSTDYNRTIMSCQSQLLGWLEEVQKDQYQGEPLFGDTHFQSVPIHVVKNKVYVDGEGESLLYYDYPNQEVWRRQNLQSSFYVNQVQPILNKMMDILRDQYHVPIASPRALSSFIDTYHSNKSIPVELHPVFNHSEHKRTLQFLYTVLLYMDIFYSPDQITVTTTRFFTNIKDNILAAIQNTSSYRLRLYSAHDVTLMNLLTGFNLSNAELVYWKFIHNVTEKGPWSYSPYASHLIFELIKGQNGSETPLVSQSGEYNFPSEYFVKMRYNGKYLPLWFCSNPDKCSVVDFLGYLDNNICPHYKMLAGFEKTPQSRLYITLSLSGLLAVYVIVRVYLAVRGRKANKTVADSREIVVETAAVELKDL